MNQVRPSIKLDFNFLSINVNFLSAIVKNIFTGELSTTLFKRETDCQAYLHRNSEHQESLKGIIAYAQALRLKEMAWKIAILKTMVTFYRKI